MTNRHLNIFLTVCENGNMTKAASVLYMTQPAVSQAVKELEEHYGVKLFDRINKKLYLTKAGEELREYSKKINELISEAEKAVKKKETKGLHIGANISVGICLMPGYVKRFSELYPDVEVRVNVAGSRKLEAMLLNNTLDFALYEDRMHNSSLESTPFHRDKTVVVASPDSEIASKNELTMDMIKGEKFLLREAGAGVRDVFNYLMYLRNITIEPYWESVSTEALVEAVKSDIGIAVLPYLPIKKYIDDGILKELTVVDLPLERNLNIVKNKQKELSELSEAFINMVKEGK